MPNENVLVMDEYVAVLHRSMVYADKDAWRGRWRQSRAFCASEWRRELFAGAQTRWLPWAPVNAPEERLDEDRIRIDRGTFVEVGHDEVGHHVVYPAALLPCPRSRLGGRAGFTMWRAHGRGETGRIWVIA
jgi:hypothetical protein